MDPFKRTNPYGNIFSEKPDYYTICVVTKDGKITEYDQITNPWAYIKEVKKNPNVLNAYIKNNK